MSRQETSVRKRLLQVATRLFSERGLDGVAVDEIVEEAKCNKRMVYHYFGSKEELYRAVLTETYQSIEFFEVQVLSQSQDTSLEVFLDRLVSTYLEFLKKHPQFVRMLAWENLAQAENLSRLSAPVSKNLVRGELQKTFERHGIQMSSQELDQFFQSLSALCFFTFSNRHTMKQVLGVDIASESQLHRRKDHIVELLLNYLKR